MSKTFNDPIWGRIVIPNFCMWFVDTQQFQRLRNLKQLGVASFVFQGANHTRFEHSLGVCWLAGRWVKHLKEQQPELKITQEDIRVVQLAGLLHDIGHGPFSHLFEHYLLKKHFRAWRHEEMAEKIMKECWMGFAERKRVCKIIKGERLAAKPYLAHIVNNTLNGLDADKLDYFTRDSQCTSFKIGCNVDRIIGESRVIGDELCFPLKLVDDVWNIFSTRFRLYKEVYNHKTIKQVEVLLMDALWQRYLAGEGDLAHSIDNVEDFLLLGDDMFWQMSRHPIWAVREPIGRILARDFKEVKVEGAPLSVHYGMKDENPLLKVGFFNRKGEKLSSLPPGILETLCPAKFSYQ